MGVDLLLLGLQIAGIALSLLLLYKGGGWLVDGASALALLFGVAPLVVGLTVVAYGTSMPELAVSTTASVQGNPGIAAGNVIGSNIANILLILGLSALIAPVAVPRRLFGRDLPILLGSTGLVALLAFVALSFSGPAGGYSFDRVEGVVLLACFAVYVVYFTRMAVRMSRDGKRDAAGGKSASPASEEVVDADPKGGIQSKPRAVGYLVAGLLGVLAGGYLLVLSASGLARQSGVSEEVIGLTIVAVGTSLPELVTSVIAARKNRPSIALGNIVGSNIFNGLLILGVAASIHPLLISPALLIDAVVMLLVTLLLALFLRSDWKLARWEGAVLFGGFAVYIASMFFR